MADIAFLLLIFFLLVTTIETDTGIGMTLPPPLEDEEEPPPVEERNMLRILVDADGRVLVRDDLSSIDEIRSEVRTHVTNFGEDPNYSDNPDDAVVSFQTDRNTRYDAYIDVLDEVVMAYREVWEAEAQQQGYSDWAEYTEEHGSRDNPIRDEYPFNLSLAEPDPGQQ